jgi:hypothetical protein
MNSAEQRIRQVYSHFLEDVSPLIVTYQTLQREFPIAVLNELRMCFTHIARSQITVSGDSKK